MSFRLQALEKCPVSHPNLRPTELKSCVAPAMRILHENEIVPDGQGCELRADLGVQNSGDVRGRDRFHSTRFPIP